MSVHVKRLPAMSSSFWPRRSAVALLISVSLLAPSAEAGDTEVGLPPAPEWKDGAAFRAPDGRIRLDSSAGDPLAELTKGHRRIGIGSGFFVSRDGAVVTNHHVIARCRLITVETPWNATGIAALVASDPTRDLALLKTAVTAPAAVTFATGSDLRPGAPMAVVGYPSRKLPPLSPQITSAIHAGPVRGRPLVALDAAVAPGSSGGPALDLAGRLGAVITGEINTPAHYEKTGRVVRDIAFAIPASETEQFLRDQGVTVLRSTDPTPLDHSALTSLAMRIVVRIGCWK